MGFHQYNGGSAVVAKGKDCIIIGADRKLGAQFHLISQNFQRVFKLNSKCFLILTGLATDVITFSNIIKQNVSNYEMYEKEPIKINSLIMMVSQSLYQKRFMPYILGTMVAGLDENNQPVACHYDSIGNISSRESFYVSGTAEDQLYGTMENFYQKDMEKDQLEEIIAQSFTAATDRDILSGWGGVLYTITKDRVVCQVIDSEIV